MSKINLDIVVNGFAGYVEKRDKHHQFLADIKEKSSKSKGKKMRIVVIGEIKKGKSSLLNALVGGPELSPVSSDIATSTVFFLKAGPKEKFLVHHLSRNPEKPGIKANIHKDEVRTFGTEDGNPNNRLRVDHIEIQCPSPFLRRGFELVDTPGLGGLFKKHAQVTWKHLPNADAILFVLDSVESVMTRDELDYLKKIAQFEVPIFFVQTKIDMVSTDKWQSWQTRNLEIISKILKRPTGAIPYFPVSSKVYRLGVRKKKEKIIAKSGYRPLQTFINKTLPGMKRRQLHRQIIKPALVLMREEKKELMASLKTATSSTKESLDTMEKELKENQQSFRTWKETKYKSIMKGFRQFLATQRRESQRQFQDVLNPSGDGVVVQSMEESIEDAINGDLTQINEAAGALIAEAEDKCAEHSMRIMREMQKNCQQKAQVFGDDFANDIQGFHPQDKHFESSAEITLSQSSLVRSAMSAKGAGMMATWALSGVFSGGVSAAIGVAVGLWMMKSNQEDLNIKKKDEARRKLTQVLAKAISFQRQHTLRAFEDQFLAVSRDIEEIQQTMLKQQEQRLAERKEEIQGARTRTKQESTEYAQNLKETIKHIDSLLPKLSAMAREL